MRRHIGGAMVHDLRERYFTYLDARHATCRGQLLRDCDAALVQWCQGWTGKVASSRTDTLIDFHVTRAVDCTQNDQRTLGDS
jgi:hypothetical protein